MGENDKKVIDTRRFTIIKGNGFPLAAKKINPNAPCECGSGEKAKKCCGTETKYCYSKLNETQIKERQTAESEGLKAVD